MQSKHVDYKHEDRQWDARINVQSDEYLERIVASIQAEHRVGKFKYILIGGCEIGTRPTQDDYQVRHVHIAAVFNNRCSKGIYVPYSDPSNDYCSCHYQKLEHRRREWVLSGSSEQRSSL